MGTGMAVKGKGVCEGVVLTFGELTIVESPFYISSIDEQDLSLITT